LGLVSISVMFGEDITSVGFFEEGGNSGGAAINEWVLSIFTCSPDVFFSSIFHPGFPVFALVLHSFMV